MAIIDADKLEEILSDVQIPIMGESEPGNMATASAKEIFTNYKNLISPALRSKLGARKAHGDRSKVLWKIIIDLLEAGLKPGEVVILVESTVWNKFGEDRSRLWADVKKGAARLQDSDPQSNGAGRRARKRSTAHSEPWSIPFDRYMAQESRDPAWMIEGLWTAQSHGIIAGEPKTRKSYLADDIGLSVATGTGVLGHFPVKQRGPVLLIQEEISDAEQKKRLRYMAVAKGLGGESEKVGRSGISVVFPNSVPLYLRNRKSFDLTSVEEMEKMTNVVVELEIILLILDPLQLMLGQANENHAHEVRPILQNLLKLKEATGVGIIIVHHYSKNQEKQGGQRMLGTQAFHGWCESALYLDKPEPSVTRVQREFRNFEPMPDFDVEYLGGNERYDVQVVEKKPKRPPRTSFDRLCLKHLGTSVKALAKHLKTSDMVIRRKVEKSPYLELSTRQRKDGGRPISIVVKANGE